MTINTLRRFATKFTAKAAVSALAAAGMASALLAAPAAQAQTTAWPNKTVRIVVGFAPGGSTDLMARILAKGLSDNLGQSFVIDNKPGASGNIAAQEVIKAAPDGSTFLIAPTSVETANPHLFKANFHPSKDLTPVAGIGRTQMYLVTRPDFPGKTAAELVAMAKAQPGKLTYASAGAGTPPHLAGELFKQQANVFVTHIPYRGAAPALQDVLGSQADFVFDPGIALPHIRSGKVKLLGVVSGKRSQFFPDTPTLIEQGIQGAELDIWFGVWAPNGTPADVMAKLQRELGTILALPATKSRFADLAAEPAPMDTATFKKLLADEGKLFSSLIKDRAIKVD